MEWKMENPEMAARCEDKMTSFLSKRRGEMLEYLQDESKHTPELVEYLNAAENPAEHAALLEKFLYEPPEEIMTNDNPFFGSLGIALYKGFLGATRAILTPQQCLKDSPADRLFAQIYQSWDEERDVSFEALQSSKDLIIDTWRVNPTFYCHSGGEHLMEKLCISLTLSMSSVSNSTKTARTT